MSCDGQIKARSLSALPLLATARAMSLLLLSSPVWWRGGQPPASSTPAADTPQPELGLKIKQWIRPIKSRHWSTINMYAGVVRHTYLASFWYLSLYKYPKYTYEHPKYTYYQNILMKSR